MPLQYRSETALQSALALHAASAAASVRSEVSCVMKVAHCVSSALVYAIVSHAGLTVPWQKAGAVHAGPEPHAALPG